jgi:hypothetical protein
MIRELMLQATPQVPKIIGSSILSIPSISFASPGGQRKPRYVKDRSWPGITGMAPHTMRSRLRCR